MDDLDKFGEISSPEKEDFYSHLNTEDITDVGYVHAKRVGENFQIKNFQNMSLKIFELDSAHFLPAPGLSSLTKDQSKWDLSTNIYILLMVEKGISDRTCHAIYRYAEANNNEILW